MFKQLFGTQKPVIGVVHLLPLPGSARWEGQLETVLKRAEQEAVALATGGVNGIIIENFFDAPFTKHRIDAATISAFVCIVNRVKTLCDLPIGINCLRNDGLSAMAIAAITGASFIRVNVLIGAMVTESGITEGIAHELLPYRKSLNADKTVKIFADVLVKHATPVGSFSPAEKTAGRPIDIASMAKDTRERGLADALIITGSVTGQPPAIDDLLTVREALPDVPILAGSGVSKENAAKICSIVDGIVVCSSIKQQGSIENPIDADRTRTLAEAVKLSVAD